MTPVSRRSECLMRASRSATLYDVCFLYNLQIVVFGLLKLFKNAAKVVLFCVQKIVQIRINHIQVHFFVTNFSKLKYKILKTRCKGTHLFLFVCIVYGKFFIVHGKICILMGKIHKNKKHPNSFSSAKVLLFVGIFRILFYLS